jgi:hypothetical protein
VKLKRFPISVFLSFGSWRYPHGRLFGVGIKASGKIVIPISFTTIISVFLISFLKCRLA